MNLDLVCEDLLWEVYHGKKMTANSVLIVVAVVFLKGIASLTVAGDIIDQDQNTLVTSHQLTSTMCPLCQSPPDQMVLA